MTDPIRAALAQPEPEVVGPTDEEIILEAIKADLVYHPINEERYVFSAFVESHSLNQYVLAFARAVLARWGHQPTPPAEGEVAELVELLHKEAADDEIGDHMLWMTPADARRAAELLQQQQAKIQRLEQQLETERMRVVACGIIAMSDTPFSAAKNRNCHPDYWSASADDIARQIDELMRLRAQQTPVPVSERLPGPGEMDGSLVWCGSQAAGLPYWEWCLDDIRHPGSSGYTHWLPANTPALPTALPLPLPQGEVEK